LPTEPRRRETALRPATRSAAFPRPARLSLADSIADSVAEAIATGLMQPEERIIETALAERLGVSRVPIREALKVLHAQGILTGGGHRGYRVASFAPDTIEQVFEVRLMLEAILLRDALANWRDSKSDPAELDVALDMIARSARAGDAKASLRADLNFHRTICRAAQNQIAGTMWNAIARHILIIFSLHPYRDKDLFAVARQHAALRDWIMDQIPRRPSVDELRTAMEDHLLLVARRRRRVV
jgi:DNA-binding GntR family transcriptional regulator